MSSVADALNANLSLYGQKEHTHFRLQERGDQPPIIETVSAWRAFIRDWNEKRAAAAYNCLTEHKDRISHPKAALKCIEEIHGFLPPHLVAANSDLHGFFGGRLHIIEIDKEMRKRCNEIDINARNTVAQIKQETHRMEQLTQKVKKQSCDVLEDLDDILCDIIEGNKPHHHWKQMNCDTLVACAEGECISVPSKLLKTIPSIKLAREEEDNYYALDWSQVEKTTVHHFLDSLDNPSLLAQLTTEELLDLYKLSKVIPDKCLQKLVLELIRVQISDEELQRKILENTFNDPKLIHRAALQFRTLMHKQYSHLIHPKTMAGLLEAPIIEANDEWELYTLLIKWAKARSRKVKEVLCNPIHGRGLHSRLRADLFTAEQMTEFQDMVGKCVVHHSQQPSRLYITVAEDYTVHLSFVITDLKASIQLGESSFWSKPFRFAGLEWSLIVGCSNECKHTKRIAGIVHKYIEKIPPFDIDYEISFANITKKQRQRLFSASEESPSAYVATFHPEEVEVDASNRAVLKASFKLVPNR